MDNLITSERKYINQKVAELKHAAFYALKEIKEPDELIGLYQDIIRETEKHGKGTIIFDYAKLLEEQNQLYLPEEAYLFAKQSVTLNAKELLKQYHYTIAQKMNESDLCARQ